MKRLICGYQFRLVATLKPERDDCGKLREYNPRDKYGRHLSDAPFCKFVFPDAFHISGVYGIYVDDRIVYIGETNRLSRRFGPGEYGEIVAPDPVDSQTTNRRVNHGILEAARVGSRVNVWFHQTAERHNVEALIIGRLDLPWNHGAPAEATNASDTPRRHRSDWRLVMRDADAAKSRFLVDRAQGELQFDSLLRMHPSDGMVWLKRAEAYEQSGDLTAASAAFARAEALLPLERWQGIARAGLQRTRNRP
jgi:hypothetical protein